VNHAINALHRACERRRVAHIAERGFDAERFQHLGIGVLAHEAAHAAPLFNGNSTDIGAEQTAGAGDENFSNGHFFILPFAAAIFLR
jgi:hypothetical protein